MTLNEIKESIRNHNPLVLNEDESEKLDIYITALEKIIRIYDKKVNNEYSRIIREKL